MFSTTDADENVLAGQVVHGVLPTVSVYVPAGHSRHGELLVPSPV